jgi:hypothetical protein
VEGGHVVEAGAPDRRFAIPDHVLSREAAGETVLLDLESEQYYSLGGVAAQAWQLVEAGKSFTELIAELDAEYDVDEGTLRADLDRTFAELESAGLVLIRDA